MSIPLQVYSLQDSVPAQVAEIAAFLQAQAVCAEQADLTQYRLLVAEQGLQLMAPRQKKGGVKADFFSPALRRRTEQGAKDLLLRAVASKVSRSVVDATAGLGIDSFVLANAGHNVTLLEVAALPYIMCREALAAIGRTRYGGALCQRMQLLNVDALQWLQQIPTPHPDVIYLDPMFEKSGKQSALSGQGMQALQQFTHNVAPSQQLLTQAIASCTEKVIVKRPAKGEPLAGLVPNHSVSGRTVRFDVYLASR